MHDVQLSGNGKGYIAPMRIESDLDTLAPLQDDQYVLSLKDLLGVLWRRLWVILLVAVVLGGSAVAYDLWRTPIYEASVRILIGQESDQVADRSYNLGSDVEGLQQITQTMAKAVATRPVAESVIEELNLGMEPEDLLANMSAKQDGTTQFIQISYRDTNPREAQRITNAVGDLFSGRVQNISPSANGVTAMVWEPAATPDSPVSPNPLRDGLLALVLGGMLGVGLAFLLEYLDDRWRSPEEVEQVSGVPNFGVIPEIKAPKSKKGGS